MLSSSGRRLDCGAGIVSILPWPRNARSRGSRATASRTGAGSRAAMTTLSAELSADGLLFGASAVPIGPAGRPVGGLACRLGDPLVGVIPADQGQHAGRGGGGGQRDGVERL